MVEVAASVVAKNFGEWVDRAIAEPVTVTKYDRPTVVLLNAATFERLLSHYREVVDVAELDDFVASAIENSDVPAEYRWSSDEADVSDSRRGV